MIGKLGSVVSMLGFAGLATCVLLTGCVQSGAETVELLDGFRITTLPSVDGGRPAPRAVTVAPNRERFVLDTVGRVLVFSEQGQFLRSWWMPEYSVGRPEGVRVREDGSSLVADTHYNRVVEFDPQGEVVRTFGVHGREPGEFIYPVAIELDPEGNIYVAEYGGNDRVQKFDAEGNFLLQFGKSGSGPGELQRASGVVWDNGTVYVSDAVNHRVQAFTEDGQFVGVLSGVEAVELAFPYDLARHPDGSLLIPEYGVGRVTRISPAGTLLARYGRVGRGAGEFWTPWGIAVDVDGTVIVADTGNHRLVEFRP